LEGKSEDIELVNIRQMREILGVTRYIFRDVKKKVEDEFRRQYDLKEKGEAGAGSPGAERPAAGTAGDEEVGADGFSVGRAPDGAAPPESPTIGSPGSKTDEDGLPASAYDGSQTLGATTEIKEPRKRIPRSEAYEVFKTEDGAEWNSMVVEESNQLSEVKRAVKTLGERLNNDKYEIDRLKDLIDRKSRERANEEGQDDTVVIDEEEYAAMTELKKRKSSYRDTFEKLRSGKSKVTDLSASVQGNKERLLEEFDMWYTATYGAEPTKADKEENSGPVFGPGGDMLDPDEAFEKLEVERIMTKDPKSFAFTQAKKLKHTMRGSLAAGRSQGAAMRARNRKG